VRNIHIERIKRLIEKLNSVGLLSQFLEDDLQIKNFFGGGAAYVQDQIFLTMTKVGLALKLSDTDLDTIMKKGGKELRYFPKGHIKKQYAIIPEKIFRNQKDISIWITRSIKFVLADY
jgi:TfoX/Sxy family transcriptional regulator of competence genes